MKKYLILLFIAVSMWLCATDSTPSSASSHEVFSVDELIGKPTPETDHFLIEFSKMAATLGMVIALILIIAWFLKRMLNVRMEKANLNSSINVVESRMLSQKTMLYLVEVRGKGIVVAESPHGVTFLGNYPAFSLDVDESSDPPQPNS